ncbi:MAG: secretin and TonB N-terminal domain-containing protein [Acidobacteriota bacterium]
MGPSRGAVVPCFAVAALVSLVAWGSAATPGLAQQPPSVPPTFRDAIPEAQPRWSGEPVSLSLRDADLVETLRSFARLGDFNLLLQPGIKGSVTVELNDVPWDQAMAVILRTQGLGMEISGGTVRIGTQAELLRMAREEAALERAGVGAGGSLGDAARAAEPRLRVEGELTYLDAELAVSVLERGYLSERGVARSRGRTLEIVDGESRLRRVARLVAALDRPEVRGENLSALRRRAIQLWPSVSSE